PLLPRRTSFPSTTLVRSDVDGVVHPLGGGPSLVSASNQALIAFGSVTVDRAAVLSRLSSDPDAVTFRQPGAQRAAPIVGLLSDRSEEHTSDLQSPDHLVF